MLYVQIKTENVGSTQQVTQLLCKEKHSILKTFYQHWVLNLKHYTDPIGSNSRIVYIYSYFRVQFLNLRIKRLLSSPSEASSSICRQADCPLLRSFKVLVVNLICSILPQLTKELEQEAGEDLYIKI